MTLISNNMEYTFRKSVLEQPKTYRLGETDITIQEVGQSNVERIQYSEIKSIEANYAPNRFLENRYTLRLKTRLKTIDILNQSFVSMANFDDLSDQYLSFVKTLHKKLVAQNPNAEFKQGGSFGSYILNWLIMLYIILIVVGALLFFVFNGMVAIAIIKLLILLYYFPVLIKVISVKPKTYDPNNLPDKVFPKL